MASFLGVSCLGLSSLEVLPVVQTVSTLKAIDTMNRRMAKAWFGCMSLRIFLSIGKSKVSGVRFHLLSSIAPCLPIAGNGLSETQTPGPGV